MEMRERDKTMIRRLIRGAMLGTGLFLFMAMPATAQGPSDKIVEQMTPGMIAGMLKELGHQPRIEKDNRGDPMIVANLEGTKYVVIFFDCEKSGPLADRFCTDLEFYAGFTVDHPPALIALNRWNSGQAYGKAYLRENGSVVFEMAINLAKGVSESFMASSIEWWRSALFKFDQEIL
jgi:hypothetical protein